MKILSVCIPSYNRFEHLNKAIAEILLAESQDFEIVVIDNCSPRNIYDYIQYKDSRLRIVEREKSVYGVKNVGDSILFGQGKYSLLLLDKDYIKGKELDGFISVIRKLDIYGGYCELNSVNDSVNIVKDNTVEKFGYLSKHPSGNFYRMDILHDYIYKHSDYLEKDPFPFDIYLAYCASKGAMLHYDKPCVYSYLNDFSNDDLDGSLTFSKDAGNMYYFPQNRNDEFQVYLSCMNEIEIDRKKRINVLSRLYKDTLRAVTVGYRSIMKNPGICKHYHHRQENIGVIKMIKFAMAFRKVFYSTYCKDVTNCQKVGIEFLLMKRILCKIFTR